MIVKMVKKSALTITTDTKSTGTATLSNSTIIYTMVIRVVKFFKGGKQNQQDYWLKINTIKGILGTLWHLSIIAYSHNIIFPLRICWFLAQNLSNFVPLPWKFDNPYCHSLPLKKKKDERRKKTKQILWEYEKSRDHNRSKRFQLQVI